MYDEEFWEEDSMSTITQRQLAASAKAVQDSDRILSIVINKNRPGMKYRPLKSVLIKNS